MFDVPPTIVLREVCTTDEYCPMHEYAMERLAVLAIRAIKEENGMPDEYTRAVKELASGYIRNASVTREQYETFIGERLAANLAADFAANVPGYVHMHTTHKTVNGSRLALKWVS